MMSERCKTAVRVELNKLGLHYKVVDLGEVDIMEDLTALEWESLRAGLLCSGLVMMDDKRGLLMGRIKDSIMSMVYSDEDLQRCTFSSYLAEQLERDYHSLSELFTEMQGSTIEQFFIAQKAERVKELIMDGQWNMTEIAFKMRYSSVAHLSNQFKKVTGHSPSHFKQIRALKNEASRHTAIEQPE
ncbi:MAG: AraC family transcriptional regulator [Flavobacteriales bacterium]|nr:AraC family transcriptional regulator [Flavobacteriales bacterium]